jgi:MFS family permease
VPTAAASSVPSPALGQGLLLILAMGHFSAVVVRGLPSVVAADLQARFGLDDAAFGLLHGPAYVLANVVAMITAAAFIDRLDRFRTMALCILVWTGGAVGFALATKVEGLVVSRVVVGLGQAAFAPCAASLIIDRSRGGFAGSLSWLTGGSALGRSAGIMLAGLLLGVMALPMLAEAGWADWRAVQLVIALPALILAAILMRYREDRVLADDGGGLAATAGWCWSRRGLLGPFLMAASAVILLGHATTAWMPSLFQRLFDLSAAQAALVAGSTILIGAPLGHLCGGLLLDRWMGSGRSAIQVVMVSLVVAAGFGVVLGLSPSLWSSWLAATGVAFGLGVGSLSALVAFQPVTPPGRRGAVTALFFAVVSLIGMGLGPPLVGVVSDEAFGSDAGLGPAVAVVIVAVALAGALIASLTTPRWTRLERQAVANG